MGGNILQHYYAANIQIKLKTIPLLHRRGHALVSQICTLCIEQRGECDAIL